MRSPCILLAVLWSATAASAQDIPTPIVVNECAVGSGGWIELLNQSNDTRELARDPASCWLVDDADGGGTPKLIEDSAIEHASSSTTCRKAGRAARCGLIGPGEHVWVKYAYLNAKTPDRCRILSAPRSSAGCGAALRELSVGGPSSGVGTGQCYGRSPDGAGWNLAPLACSQGAANASCERGAACEDGDPCTTGERFTSRCDCSGGTRRPEASGCGLPGASAPVIVRHGSAGLLLSGTIVTPAGPIEGEVLIVDDRIVCVAESCQGETLAQMSTIVRTNGIVFPGLIDTHNHVQFDIFDEADWSPEAKDNFTNHDQWPNRARYKALVDTKQYLNGEAGSQVKIGCELLKYGELKALVAGTTSVVGAPIPSNQACFGSLVRSIDQGSNGLAADKVQTSTPFPSRESADAVCKNLASGKTDSFLIHIAEGIDETAHREFKKLGEITSTPGCLLQAKTTIVHGAALDELDFATMARHGMGLVWSPRSNVFLYGHGTDLQQTSNIPAALERGITIALAPDWSIGGSQNLLDELSFADTVDNKLWGDAISSQQLVGMATSNPARLLGLSNVLGSIAVGFKADLMVVSGDRRAPYDALVRATPKAVQLVMVGGSVLYGERSLQALAARPDTCEALPLCGGDKFVCARAPNATPANKLGQSYAEIRQIIDRELTKYDARNLTPYDFAPIAELYRCPPEQQPVSSVGAARGTVPSK